MLSCIVAAHFMGIANCLKIVCVPLHMLGFERILLAMCVRICWDGRKWKDK